MSFKIQSTECQINRLKFDSCHYNCLYSWCIFKRKIHIKNFRTYYFDWVEIFQSKRKRYHFLRSRSIWSFQRIHQELNFCILLELGNWLHISTSLFWPQPKHSIPISSYISDLLYRVAFISWFLCKSFNCIKTATEFLNY